jgi:Replication-relaxation
LKPGSRAGVILQPRDRVLLEALRVLRLIDREQAEVLAPFGSIPRANARLLQLCRAGLLRSFRWGSISGGRKCLYYLPSTRLGRSLSIEHELALGDVYAGFHGCGVEWIRPDQPLAPECPVIPDGIVSIGGLPHLVEVDRGTEALSVIAKKADSYLALAMSGQAEAALGNRRFRVCIVTTSERRLRNLARVIAGRTEKLFWLTTLDQLRQKSPWGEIWSRPMPVDALHSLIVKRKQDGLQHQTDVC